MLELPTIETDFLFKNSQDFNQTTHARPQHPIVFIHNIRLIQGDVEFLLITYENLLL